MSRPLVKTTTLVTCGALLAACGGDAGSSASTQPVVRLNFASQPAAAAAAARMASIGEPYTVTDGSGNTLIFESVQMVMREIELKRADRDVVCADGQDTDTPNEASDCVEMEFGPILFDLPLGAGPERALSVELAAGSYDKLEFTIHKPSSSDDAAFLAANPAFDGVSVRVTGSYNGTPFTYTSDLDVEQEQEFSPALQVAEAQATELTVFVSLDDWFRDGSGALVDPETANDGQPNEGLVKSNIESSVNAFEDGDRDGSDD